MSKRIITVVLTALSLLVMLAPMASASRCSAAYTVQVTPAPNDTSVVPNWKDIARSRGIGC